MRQLSTQISIIALLGATAAGQTLVKSTTIDTQGFDSLSVLADIGAAAGATTTLSLLGGEAADGSDAAALSGAVATVAAGGAANKTLCVEIHRPMNRYLTAQVTRTVADSAILEITALAYGASNMPVAQPTFAVPAVAVVSPPLVV